MSGWTDHPGWHPGRRAMTWAAAVVAGLLLLTAGVVVGMAAEANRSPDFPTPDAVDIGFAQDMSEHHDQAILLANTLRGDIAPEVRGLADKMVAAQSAETATMRGWLTWFDLPHTSDQPMAWMPAHGHSSHSGPGGESDDRAMPGMASVEEIGRLAAVTGVEAEILFLQLMIRHHLGGLEMATAAQNHPQASPATKRMALSMISDQGNEIGQMRMMLRVRGAQALP